MQKKRLNKTDKAALLALAERLTRASISPKKRDLAYKRLADQTLKEVEKMYPPKEMGILIKYGKAHASRDVIFLIENRPNPLNFYRHNNKITVTLSKPVTYPNSTLDREFKQGTIIDKKWLAYIKEHEEYEAKVSERLADYKAVINNAHTFEKLCTIWPEAEELKSQIVPEFWSLSPVDDGVKNRIAADVKKRKKAEA